MAGIIDSATSTSGVFTAVRVEIPNYTDAHYKSVISLSSKTIGQNTAATTSVSAVGSEWRNTGAITSIAVAGMNEWANAVAGTALTLYGLY